MLPFRTPSRFSSSRSSTSSLLLSATLPSFGSYIEQALPMVMARGTQFYAVIVPVEVFEGEYNDDFLFITEWASRDAFDAHHEDEAFLSIVHLRNDVLTRWIEAEAVLGKPPVRGDDEDDDNDEWSEYDD